MPAFSLSFICLSHSVIYLVILSLLIACFSLVITSAFPLYLHDLITETMSDKCTCQQCCQNLCHVLLTVFLPLSFFLISFFTVSFLIQSSSVPAFIHCCVFLSFICLSLPLSLPHPAISYPPFSSLSIIFFVFLSNAIQG